MYLPTSRWISKTISFDLRYLTHKTYKGIWLPSQIPVYCNFSSFSVVPVVPSCISVALMWRPMLTCPGLLPSLSSPLGRHHFGLCLPPSGWAISSASPGPKLGSQDVRKPPLCGGRWPEAVSSSNWHCHPWLISACPCVFFCEVIFSCYLLWSFDWVILWRTDMQISPQLAFETKLSDTIPQASNPLHTGNLTGGKHLYLKFSALFYSKKFSYSPKRANVKIHFQRAGVAEITLLIQLTERK